MEEKAQILEKKLEDWFSKIDKVAIALSGGIDSSIVVFFAHKYLGAENTVAIISASASVKQKELKDARDFTSRYKILLEEIDAKEIDDINYSNNPVDRCFYCKSALYKGMEKLIKDKYPGYTVLNGNNFSDLGDYRPGLKAAIEHRVYSPLADCKFTKDDIRLLALHNKLPNWNKPASPCLSSRFPYGESINEDKLRMVEAAEDLLNIYGFDDVRVRYMENIALIEVKAEKVSQLRAIFKEIKPDLKSIGFDSIEIDPEGLVSGKLNRGIDLEEK